MLRSFFIGIGPDVLDVDDDITMLQYNDYITSGTYKDREKYEVQS